MTRFTRILFIVVLGLTGSVAMAQDKNCSDISNAQVRRQCMEHKAAGEVDCSKLSDPQARKQCVGKKQDNNAVVDCSKLATAQQRQQCARQKAN